MRATLLFPPLASPTYVPLGVATLAGHARRAVPDLDLRVIDLNIAAWRQALQAEALGADAGAFFSKPSETFFDPDLYAGHQATLACAEARLRALSGDARRYVETGEASAHLVALLDRQRQAALAGDPELVGVSLMFLDQLPFALALARAIDAACRTRSERPEQRARPRVVLGGAALSALRDHEILRACPYVGALVVGEGEAAWEALCRNTGVEHTPGLSHRMATGIRSNPMAAACSLREAPPPDFSDLDLALYLNPEPVLPAVISRGCQWRRCRFCAHNLSFSSYRRKSLDAFLGELVDLSERHGARHVYLADQYINAPELEQLCLALAAAGLDLRLHVMGRPVGAYTPGRLKNLARGGCRWISWGVESGSQRLLDLSGKGTRVETIEAVVRGAADAGISNLLMMILGLPTSTDEDLGQTLRLLDRLAGRYDSCTASVFALFERTVFGRNASRYAMQVQGPELLLRPAGQPIHSRRLRFREVSGDGSLRAPRGPLEARAVRSRWQWQPSLRFRNELPCEHTLLFAARGGEPRSEDGSQLAETGPVILTDLRPAGPPDAGGNLGIDWGAGRPV